MSIALPKPCYLAAYAFFKMNSSEFEFDVIYDPDFLSRGNLISRVAPLKNI
jgi:hypothetical protein